MTLYLGLEEFTLRSRDQLQVYFPSDEPIEPVIPAPLGFMPLGFSPLGTPGETPVEDRVGTSWHGLVYLNAIGRLIQVVEDLAREDKDGNPGWSILLDVDRTPNEGLPWLGQFTGIRSENYVDGLRTRIKSLEGFNVASPSAVEAAVKLWLTGAKTAYMNPRADGEGYEWLIITQASETPYPDLVLAEIMKQKPAGVVLQYGVSSSWDFISVAAAYEDFADVRDSFVDFQALADNNPS